MKLSPLLLCSLLLLFVGCHFTSPDTTELAEPGPGFAAESAPPRSLGFAVMNDPSSAASLRERAQAGLAVMSEIRRTFVAPESWHEADAALQAALTRPSSAPDLFEHHAAVVMLDQYLLNAALPPEGLDVLAHHTASLLRHRTLSVGLVAEALVRLEGHLPEAEHRHVAREALTLAEDHLSAFTARGEETGRRAPGAVASLTAATVLLRPMAG